MLPSLKLWPTHWLTRVKSRDASASKKERPGLCIHALIHWIQKLPWTVLGGASFHVKVGGYMISPKLGIKTHLLSPSERSKFPSAPCPAPLSVIGDMTALIGLGFEQFTSNCVSGLVWASQGFCRSETCGECDTATAAGHDTWWAGHISSLRQ